MTNRDMLGPFMLVALGAFAMGLVLGHAANADAVAELNCHHRAATFNIQLPVAVVDTVCGEVWGGE